MSGGRGGAGGCAPRRELPAPAPPPLPRSAYAGGKPLICAPLTPARHPRVLGADFLRDFFSRYEEGEGMYQFSYRDLLVRCPPPAAQICPRAR